MTNDRTPTLLAAAMQARFALRELLPNDPDARMTVRMLDDAITAVRAAEERVEAAPGWKLVPVEATREMIDAVMLQSDADCAAGRIECLSWTNWYRTMVAAAPQSPEPPASQALQAMVEHTEALGLYDDDFKPEPPAEPLRDALERIANMRDRDGHEIEMHRDELRGIARAALRAWDRARAALEGGE